MRKILFALIAVIVVNLFVGCSKPPHPDVNQIKIDLIGRDMRTVNSKDKTGERDWYFDSPTEFITFNVSDKKDLGDLIEFHVNMDLKGIVSGNEYYAEAIINYKLVNGKWEIVTVLKKKFEEKNTIEEEI